MSSSEESDDDCSFSHWNNWSGKASNVEKSESDDVNEEKNVSVNKSKVRAAMFSKKISDRFGNWISPNNWKNKNNLKPLQIKKASKKISKSDNQQEIAETSCALSGTSSVTQDKKNTLDWENRRHCLDLNNLPENNFTWNLIRPGIFYKINLRCNEYGNICGLAQGKVLKMYGCKEGAVLVIDKPDLLRKLLQVSASEWASLCDSVKEGKLNLNYDAYENYDISKLSSLQKLWVFLCKRRNFIPAVCISFCLNGAMKVMKEFQVLPKLVIKDIYDFQGNYTL